MLGCPKEFLVWIALDHSGLLGIAKAGDGKLLIKLVKSTKVADKVGGPPPLGLYAVTTYQGPETLMIIAVHAVTSRRNTRPRAVTFLGTGEQEYDRIDKVCDKVSLVPYCVVLKEGNLVSSAAMGRWHTPPPPVPAVPPSQTNDCKGFLPFKPSQRRPKMAVGRPKRRSVSWVCVLRVRNVVGEDSLLGQSKGIFDF